MGDAYIVRRGGGDQGIKITASKTRPSTGKNHIWVKTNTPYTNACVSYVSPAGPLSGDIWIRTSSYGKNTLTLFRKNTITIAIDRAFQYKNGVWKQVNAYVSLNDVWTQFSNGILRLFNGGDNDSSCMSVTGGWTFNSGGDGPNGVTGWINNGNEALALQTSEQWASGWGEWKTNKVVSFEGVNTLHVFITPESDYKDIKVYIGDRYWNLHTGDNAINLPLNISGIVSFYSYKPEAFKGYLTSYATQIYAE